MKTEIIAIHSTFPETDKIIKCAKIIRQGGLVIFPTETVYGVAADYTNKKAMERLREIKKRPEDKPFSVLLPKKESVEHLMATMDTSVYKLIDRYWPGPLTIVVPSKEGGKTIGLRMPDNMIALNLAKAAGCPVAAPSANFIGAQPPTTCQEALRDLDGLVDIAIDGGPTMLGRESTVLDMSVSPPKILRDGPVTSEEIEQTTKQKVILFVCTGNSCRSVMAEYLLQKYLNGRDDVKVVSAGTGVFVSMGASADTIAVLKKEGIDATMHRSQSIEHVMLKKADLVLVMARMHREQLLRLVPDIEHKIYLLREFAQSSKGPDDSLDIPDPIGKPYSVYEECMATIREGIGKIAKLV